MTEEQKREAVGRLAQGRSLDEYFTDRYLSVAEEDLMSFQEFRRLADRDKVSESFLSGWVVVSREALRNLLRLVVRDAIGMTDNLDPVRDIVRTLNLRPEDPPIPTNLGEDIGEDGETGDRRDDISVPDRLWVVRERIRSLRDEVGELTGLTGYHSGSRLSRVVDVLSQAETLTEEAMSPSGQAHRD